MMSIIQTLRQRLAQNGEMPFVDFMQLALYDKDAGYYSSFLHKIGPHGDFITAPELSPLFGKTLAHQCRQVLPKLDAPILFEFGAGTGALCVDILSTLDAENCLPQAYQILEVSADLRMRQQELIQQKIPHLYPKVQWLNHWPEKPFNGIILANEVLDAMPVHRFMCTDEGILESFVLVDEQGLCAEQFKPSQNQRLVNHIQTRLPHLATPYLSEVNLFVDDWLKSIYQMLNQGLVLLCDYGFPRHECYHPDRATGTLMCHYQHTSHTDPFIHIGKQDITAHVDFTHVAEAADLAGFRIAGYTNQASFLLANGLLSFTHTIEDEKELFRAKQAIKQLTSPSEMGELFKIIALTKGLDMPLNGFQLYDKRASL